MDKLTADDLIAVETALLDENFFGSQEVQEARMVMNKCLGCKYSTQRPLERICSIYESLNWEFVSECRVYEKRT